MKITIIENETGKVIATYPINIAGLNYTPSEKEACAEAWRCAVEDGLVNADQQDNYTLEITDQT